MKRMLCSLISVFSIVVLAAIAGCDKREETEPVAPPKENHIFKVKQSTDSYPREGDSFGAICLDRKTHASCQVYLDVPAAQLYSFEDVGQATFRTPHLEDLELLSFSWRGSTFDVSFVINGAITQFSFSYGLILEDEGMPQLQSGVVTKNGQVTISIRESELQPSNYWTARSPRLVIRKLVLDIRVDKEF